MSAEEASRLARAETQPNPAGAGIASRTGSSPGCRPTSAARCSISTVVAELLQRLAAAGLLAG